MTELADRYKVSIAAIGYVLKKMTGNGLKPQLSQSERKAIVAALQSGKTTEAELGVKYGVTYSTISRTYKKETGKPWKTRLAETDKNAIVAELLAGKAKTELVAEYRVSKDTIERTFKHQVGKPLTEHKRMMNTALKQSSYRAWHMGEKKMYAVLGLDWLNQKVLTAASGVAAWHEMGSFIIMRYSGLRDRKRTPKFPKGQEIFAGDIVQFPINQIGNDERAKKTMVTDVVTLEQETGWFVLPQVDADPLGLHNDECEVIGTVYDNPEIIAEHQSQQG